MSLEDGLLDLRRVPFKMVRNKRYQDRESGMNSLDIQASKMKLVLEFFNLRWLEMSVIRIGKAFL